MDGARKYHVTAGDHLSQTWLHSSRRLNTECPGLTLAPLKESSAELICYESRVLGGKIIFNWFLSQLHVKLANFGTFVKIPV